MTPSLQTEAGSFNEGPGSPSFAIRGIGTNVFGPQVESSVGIVVDDVPLSRVQLGNIQFFDIDNVEVLRGPQGMLFGKNAAAGLINIVTNNPVLNETDFLAHVQYGNMDTPSGGIRRELMRRSTLRSATTQLCASTGSSFTTTPS